MTRFKNFAFNRNFVVSIHMPAENDASATVLFTDGKKMEIPINNDEERAEFERLISLPFDEKTIRIKYHSDQIEKLKYIDGKSDWIDLRAAEHVELKKGDFKLVSLGVSMEIPKGYEAHLAPRSSTFKNYGILQTNSIGVIDNSYSGDNDIWKMPVYATRDCVIEVNDRIAQFRIMKNQPPIFFEETEHLGDQDRGGFGSTGVR